MEAEYIARIRIQASLAEKFLLALVIIHAVGMFLLPDTRILWTGGLILALLASVMAFLSQHFFVIACSHEMGGRQQCAEWPIAAGTCCILIGLVLAIASIACIPSAA